MAYNQMGRTAPAAAMWACSDRGDGMALIAP